MTGSIGHTGCFFCWGVFPLDSGLVLSGVFISATERVRDGKSSGWYVMIVCGMDSYRVSVSVMPDVLDFGQAVRLSVRVGCYNGRLFFNGKFME